MAIMLTLCGVGRKRFKGWVQAGEGLRAVSHRGLPTGPANVGRRISVFAQPGAELVRDVRDYAIGSRFNDSRPVSR